MSYALQSNSDIEITGTEWEMTGWGAAQQKGIWGARQQQAQHEPAVCLAAKKTNRILGLHFGVH